MNIVLLGFPGAGKGTQAVKLEEKYGFKHISTGDLIRAEILSGTPLGKQVSALIEQGNLVPDSLITDILINAIKEEKKGVIFDGYPRTISQAEALNKYLAQHGQQTDAIVLIQLTEEEVLRRLTSRRICKSCGAIYNIYSKDYTGVCTKCGGELYTRPDDEIHSAQHRLEVFKKETEPLLSYYGSKENYVTVDGSKTEEEVFSSITAALGLIK